MKKSVDNIWPISLIGCNQCEQKLLLESKKLLRDFSWDFCADNLRYFSFPHLKNRFIWTRTATRSTSPHLATPTYSSPASVSPSVTSRSFHDESSCSVVAVIEPDQDACLEPGCTPSRTPHILSSGSFSEQPPMPSRGTKKSNVDGVQVISLGELVFRNNVKLKLGELVFEIW